MNETLTRTLARMKVKPKCPFCGQEMVFRHSMVTPAPLTDSIFWKCLNCCYLAGFCVPISHEDYEYDLALRNGQPNYSPYWQDGIYPDVNKEQLYALGYLECNYAEAIKRRDGKCL